MPTKVIMPKLGESVVEGTVTAWLKKEGDQIEEYEALLEVNTDKVDTEVPRPASGTVLKILVKEEETVEAGTVLAWIGEPGEEVPETSAAEAHDHEPHETPDSESITDEPVMQRPAGRDEDLGYISPVVARLAREKNVDLSKVQGTGMNGRVTKKDLLQYIKERKGEAEAEVPIWETPADGDLFRPTEMVFAKSEEESVPKAMGKSSAIPGETLPLTPMRKRIAEHMVKSKHSAPHVTTVMEADLNRVVAHRAASQREAESRGARLTYTAYFLSAIVAGLKAVPLANSSWTEEGIRIHQQINLGMAVAMPDGGLIVPVIQQADELSLLGMARAISDLAERARQGKLEPDEVQGGTFTLTNHGTKGSLFATPVINQPQSGILGAGMIQKRPVVVNDAIAIRPMVYLSYAFDHRILDGASADTFLAHVVHALENWPKA
ncbi:MAG TPA: dihydrolipoamide acetyltransferase family protein [Desulfobacterales bacterium]|nr:dihydrolipoamide acetyltransferase family protein [Desulfobacterales bacterium]